MPSIGSNPPPQFPKDFIKNFKAQEKSINKQLKPADTKPPGNWDTGSGAYDGGY